MGKVYDTADMFGGGDRRDGMATTGKQERDRAIALVLSKQSPEWRRHYRMMAMDWMAGKRAGDTFIGEDLHGYMLMRGIGEPHHPNAWGANARAMLKFWLKHKLIELDGMRPMAVAGSHARLSPCYRVLP